MVSISPASASDLPRLAEIQRLAFSGSRIQELCFGKCTAEDSDANTVARLLKAIDDPEQAVWKAVKDDQIVGLALWGLPHEYEEEPKPEEKTEEQRLVKLKARFPAGADYELCDAFFATLDLGIKDPHFHLGICVVDPRVQRSGAGSALVRWGCAQADKLGVDAYLEASDVGIRTYEKAGFAQFREPIRGGPDGSMVLYPMRRPPLVIKPATAAQLPAIAAIHRTAFAPTLWFNSLWGKVDPAVFDEWFVNEAKAWLKTDHVLVAMRGEDILGYASWEEKSGPTEEAQSAEPTFPEGTNLPVALAFSRDMGNYTSSIKGRFWHLHYLATSPAFQKSGAGKALIQWGVSRAQAEGLPVHLEGGSEALPLYEKLGFTPCASPIAGIDHSFADTPLILPPLLLSPAQPTDLSPIATLHRESFWPSLFYRAMFSNVKEEDFDRWNVKRMRKWLAGAGREGGEGKHWTVVAKRGEALIGYAHYEVGEGKEGERDAHEKEVESEFDEFPEGTDVEAARVMFDAIVASERSIRGGYIMLHQLASSVRHQKQGAGKLLLQYGLDLAERLKLDLYLDATPEGRRLYDAMGFKMWAPTLKSEVGTQIFPMVHRASPPSSTSTSATSPPAASSSPLKLNLSPATPNDLPTLCRIMREAFAPQQVYQMSFRDCTDAAYDGWNMARMERWVASEARERREGRRHWTVVTRRGEGEGEGEIVGFGHWELHKAREGKGDAELEPEPEIPLPEGTDMEQAKALWAALERVAGKIEGDYYMLHQVAVDPSAQRCGAGKALVQWGVDLAAKGGLPYYLDSTPAGKPLYDHLGFVQWDETTRFTEQYPEAVTYPMVYKSPQKEL